MSDQGSGGNTRERPSIPELPPTRPPATVVQHSNHCKGSCLYDLSPHYWTPTCVEWRCEEHNVMARPRPTPVPR